MKKIYYLLGLNESNMIYDIQQEPAHISYEFQNSNPHFV